MIFDPGLTDEDWYYQHGYVDCPPTPGVRGQEGAGGGNELDDLQQRFPSIDWESAFTTDYSKVDWLPGRFMERGQQVTLVGGGKVGKSLFSMDWAFHCVSGKSFLGDDCHEPLKVLYFDKENGMRDIITRMISLGAKPHELKNLVYKPFPNFNGTLDGSAFAAAELLAIVDDEQPDIVIIDTVSRFIQGNENDSSTWLALYRRIHEPLKARGIACLRLDHFGKDEERGSRGSSSKSQDVDHVWELKLEKARPVIWDPETDIEIVSMDLKMTRTHTRSGLGRDFFQIARHGRKYRDDGGWLTGATLHVLMDGAVPAATKKSVGYYVELLIDSGMPASYGLDRMVDWCKEKGIDLPGKKDTRQAIVRAYKESVIV